MLQSIYHPQLRGGNRFTAVLKHNTPPIKSSIVDLDVEASALYTSSHLLMPWWAIRLRDWPKVHVNIFVILVRDASLGCTFEPPLCQLDRGFTHGANFSQKLQIPTTYYTFRTCHFHIMRVRFFSNLTAAKSLPPRRESSLSLQSPNVCPAKTTESLSDKTMVSHVSKLSVPSLRANVQNVGQGQK